MKSKAIQAFDYSMQDSTDLLKHFDALNIKPPDDIEVLKRASLVMALASLETYFEDRIAVAVETICSRHQTSEYLAAFFRTSLEVELRSFHRVLTTMSGKVVLAIY